jgi:hypothetical protein
MQPISPPIPAASPDILTSTALSTLPASPAVPAPAPPLAPEIGANLLAAVARSRTALARGIEALSDEVANFARHNLDMTTHTAIRMLGVRTWADAIAVNTGFARASFDHWLDSTAKVSELGLNLAFESSKAFVSEFGKVWNVGRPAH